MLHPRFSLLRRPSMVTVATGALAVGALAVSSVLAAPLPVEEGASVTHLVVSELLTGGASASDEFIEVYNPTAGDLPLEGVEVIYVTASGTTITRKATWETGAPPLPPGRHVLLANASGAYATMADATYSGGLAATGGSVAIRMAGASVAVDAVGWGSATNGWTEGSVAVVPVAGHSLERLPGGAAGSGQDTDDNALDFVEREVPGPENLSSPAVPAPTPEPTPSAMPTPSAVPTTTPTPLPTPSPTPVASPTATPAPLDIAAARQQPDGAVVTIEGTALTGSTFSDGGGYVEDGTAGVAVIVTDGSFPRGSRVRITGTIGDRYAQRTIRADGAQVTVLGDGEEPAAMVVSTGAIGEAVEGELVAAAGSVAGPPSVLSDGLAFDLDDGSGTVRLVIGTGTGIDAGSWTTGTAISLYGVAGQRDSSGTGTGGYRLMPRDEDDLLSVVVTPAPSATPTPGGSTSPGPSGSPGPTVVSIAAARQAPKNSSLAVQGVVTLPSSLLDPAAAVVQDASGAIYLRLGDEVGPLATGQLVEVSGSRSTWRGMESLRVSDPPRPLGSAPIPAAAARATGAVGEPDEARLVIVRGTAASAPRRTSAGTSYFDLDDGSGALRIFLSPTLGLDDGLLAAGASLEVRGVVLQETTGQQPLRGYRLWPIRTADVVILGATVASSAAASSAAPGGTAAMSAVDATTRPLRSEAAPQLTVARAAAAALDLAADPAPGAPQPDGSPAGAAVLLVLAALLVSVAAGLLVRGSLVARVRGLAADHAGRAASLATGESNGPTADPGAPLPDLVPMALVMPRARTPGGLSASDADGGSGKNRRILPPT